MGSESVCSPFNSYSFEEIISPAMENAATNSKSSNTHQTSRGLQRCHFRRSEKRLTAQQIAKREADLLHTKRSSGYSRYVAAVAVEHRRRSCAASWHPRTPSPSQPLSVRQWRDVLGEWRRQVHRWANLPEAVFNQVVALPSCEQLEFLSSLRESELDDRDDVFPSSSAAAAEEEKLSSSTHLPFQQSRGMSSEQLSHHLLLPDSAAAAASSPTSGSIFKEEENAEEKTFQRPHAYRSRPVLFLPSWFHTFLHRKGFDIVHENDMQAMVNVFGERAVKRNCADAEGTKKTSLFLSSVYNLLPSARVSGRHISPTTEKPGSEVGALQRNDFSEAESLSPDRFKSLPLDLQFRLQNRLPPLVGVLTNVRQQQTCTEAASSNCPKVVERDRKDSPGASAVNADGVPPPSCSVQSRKDESVDRYIKRRAVLRYLDGTDGALLQRQSEISSRSLLTCRSYTCPTRLRRKRFS